MLCFFHGYILVYEINMLNNKDFLAFKASSVSHDDQSSVLLEKLCCSFTSYYLTPDINHNRVRQEKFDPFSLLQSVIK